MANLQALKSRIDSIQKTASITKAMYQIASSKLVSTQQDYLNYQGYKKAFDQVMGDILNEVTNNPYLEKEKPSPHKLFILISADRGLVGSYHQNLFKYFLNDIKDMDPSLIHLVTIGRKAYGFAGKNELDMVNESIIPNHDHLSEIIYEDQIHRMITAFLNNDLGEVVVYSNHFVNSMTQKPVKEVLLPLAKKDDAVALSDGTTIYEGGEQEILNDIVFIYLQSRIYGLLLDAKLSEFSSRIIAMKSATDNANEALESLKLKYHKARQHKITSDLLDISNAKL